MSTGNKQDFESEDYFAETRMSFGDHIEELRTHLWRAIIGFLFCVLISFFFGNKIVEFIAWPVEEQLGAFYERRVEKVKKQIEEGGDPEIAKLNKPQDFDLLMAPKQFENTFKSKPNPDQLKI